LASSAEPLARDEHALFAEISTNDAAGARTHRSTNGLTGGATTNRLACSRAGCSAHGTTHDGSRPPLPFSGNGRARRTAHRAANHRAGVSAQLLTEEGSGSPTERTAERGLAAFTG